MTKQNTHSEHGDVDTSIVEHLPVSETNASPSSSEAAEPVGEAIEAPAELPVVDTGISSGEHVTQHMPEEERQNFSSRQENQNVQEQPFVASQSEPEEDPVAASLGSSIADALIVEEEVRAFTDFIEEFRQAEGRFNSSLQAYQAESLSLLTPGVEDVAVRTEHSALKESKVDDAGAQSITPVDLPTEKQAQEKEARSPSESPAAETASITPAERPVSPLLRPASRLRLPRHGGGRHREEQPVEKNAAPEAETLNQTTEEPKVGSAVTDPTPVEEQPRPARRYRFDRPAPSTSNAPVRSEENKDTANRGAAPVPQVSPRLENGRVTNGQTSEKEVQVSPQTNQRAAGAQLPEQGPPKKQPIAQEVPAGESSTSTTPVTAPVQEHDRRRRDKQRGKEQPIPAPTATAVTVTEVASTTPEPVPSQQKEEASPEDLPPLEYAELQKASSRRRRRRHTGSSVAVAAAPVAAKATAPEVPPLSSIPAQMPFVMPSAPSASANAVAPANQHTIISGYTVNQMNQGRDGTNPFMGPEPSPAHGSIAAQHVRSIRTDVQRTPAYPVRTTEATSASVHQLASIVSQAIQTQTDRMIAELRHANQAPTNISVTMPPFPSNERVGVFVDVANLLYSARTLRMAVDFGKLLDFLRGNRRLIRAQAYCPTSPQPGDEQMFLQAVKGLGYRITTKNYKTFSSGAKKADLDLDLCMDVVRLVDGKAVDCIVLVSGDSDFMPMLDYCSDHGVRVEVAAFDEAMSATLRQGCDLFINLSMLDEIRV